MRKFPNCARRPELHSKMLEFYASAGESDAVIKDGREFLANFPNAPQRTSVALLMADAYSRKDDSASEFAIYDSVLKSLPAKTQNVPIGSAEKSSVTRPTILRTILRTMHPARRKRS